MVLNIEQDYLRFRQIVRGKIKQDLKKYISQGELIGKKGKDFVSIPIPQIEMPNFRFGRRNAGGVGQGDGEVGTPLSPGDVDDDGAGQAGNAAGAHILEVDLTMEELAQILAEELELPRIQPKGTNRIKTERDHYSQVSKVGPESLRHFKRTYKEALRRQITAGTYDPMNPYIVPIHEDKRYLSWKTKAKPESNALILYMMDVSGSMGDEQKEIVRIESFWIDTWIKTNYNGVVTRYIIHDAVAQEVAGYIASEVDRTNSLITRFLEFARPLRLRTEIVDVTTVVDRAIAQVERHSPPLPVSIHRNYSPDAPPVPIDAELMERVFYNLVLNAAQASPRQGAVTVKTRPADGGVEVSVIDRGAGIDPKHLENIFNPFFTTKSEGVGLGLAIVSKIVDEHDGKIVVESQPGEGSVFRVYLPLHHKSE